MAAARPPATADQSPGNRKQGRLHLALDIDLAADGDFVVDRHVCPYRKRVFSCDGHISFNRQRGISADGHRAFDRQGRSATNGDLLLNHNR